MKIVPANELSNWTGRMVDVREPDEFAREHLGMGSCESVPLGQIGTAAAAWDRSAPVLVLCKSGARSRQAATQLEGLGFSHVAMLDGGLQACRAAGVPVTTTKAPLPMMRQVMIGAGLFLLTGLVLSLLHPTFIALTWFVAIMLVIAGVSGFCPMACILARMPWNQASCCSGSSCTPRTQG